MNNQELISVIIPIYNVEKYLKECIESVINQTYTLLEIILIDDGSTDNSLKICKELAKIDSRIKLYHKDNGGLADARNYGIDRATGKYITFLDSDDFIEKDMYEVLYNDLVFNKAQISGCDYYIFCNNRTVKSDDAEKNICIMNTEKALIKMNELIGFGLSACNKLFLAQLFDNIRFPKGKLNEDWYIMYKILDKADVIVYNPVAKYYYRQRENSITKKNTINYNPIFASKDVLDFTEKKYPNAVANAKLAYINANLGVYSMLLNNKKNKTEMNEIINNIKKYYKSVLKLKNVKIYKKIQIILICKNISLYNLIIKSKEKMSRNRLMNNE